MHKDVLFDLLVQQGFRLLGTNFANRWSLFEWRTERIVLTHPSSDEDGYSQFELATIDFLVAHETDHEVSVLSLIDDGPTSSSPAVI